jgi:hypothetical protein
MILYCNLSKSMYQIINDDYMDVNRTKYMNVVVMINPTI